MKNESWDVRMDGDMVIAGLSERTREAYLRAVRQLAKFHRRADPGTLEEQHVKDYLLWLRTEKRAAPGTLRIAFNGIRFFYRHSCPRDWITLLKFRIPKGTKLPTVLTIDEVQRIMNAIQRPRIRAYFWTVYSLVHVIIPGGGIQRACHQSTSRSASSGSSTQTGERRTGGGIADGDWKSTQPGFARRCHQH